LAVFAHTGGTGATAPQVVGRCHVAAGDVRAAEFSTMIE
jgi:hypothetical protein